MSDREYLIAEIKGLLDEVIKQARHTKYNLADLPATITNARGLIDRIEEKIDGRDDICVDEEDEF